MDQYWVLSFTLPNKRNYEAVNEFLLKLKLANRIVQERLIYIANFLKSFL